MKLRSSRHGVIALLITVLLSGCASSPSVLSPHGTDATRVAWLTWLRFAITGIVLVVVSALLWMAYRRSRREARDEDLYVNDRKSLQNVVLGGGVAPLVAPLIVKGLGIATENSANNVSAKGEEGNTNIEVIGHQWWREVHYANHN